MRFATSLSAIAIIVSLTATGAQAQTSVNLIALKNLAPFALLENTPAGQAALAANYTITGDIQTGISKQPLLLPFAAQEEQALKDAFITGGNGAQLADGLGTTRAAAYQAAAAYTSPDDGKDPKALKFTSASDNIKLLIGYTAKLTAADAAAGKYFFSNGTTDGKTPVSADAAAILTAEGGITDVFGKAYNLPASNPKADPYGDSRPYMTEKTLKTYSDPDYFNVTISNTAYLSGPIQDLTKSPAWPSGHTTYGYTESLLFAVMVPSRYPQMITRAAEYGNDRIIIGAHYAMDVIAGRTLASYDVAHLLANDPAYVGAKEGKFTIADYQAALKAAKADMTKLLATAKPGADTSRFHSLAKDETFYESTQTYGLPAVYPAMVGKTEDVAKIAPEAGYLLTAAFPRLTLQQADHILTITEGPGGGFLDDGSAFGVYSRLDLFKASLIAMRHS